MKIDIKEDGLCYAYRHALWEKVNGVWQVINTHYDRKAIIELYKDESQYAVNPLAVLEYADKAWIVDMKWLNKYLNNNRHLIEAKE